MIRKSVGLFALSLIVLATACKQESAADKITDADMRTIEAERALIGKFPKVELDKEVHDFGTIKEGDVVETEFIVKNVGETDLVISDAKGSCGCTVPEWPKEPIAPGGKGQIKVQYNMNPGPISKTITIESNATNKPSGMIPLRIKGTVIVKEEVSPLVKKKTFPNS